jgi:rare lipoprotein A
VKVRVNDRGPFTRRLVIDLSEAAARQLGMFRRGIARVTLKVLKADQP